MSLLITGGTGYIGKKLVQQLRKKNSNVYSIGIEDLNLLNYGDTLNFLKENNIKKIIHLGWSMNNGNSAIYDNIEAMSNLIKSCEEIQIEKFIFASTNNVYGTKIKNVPFSEEDRLSPDINNKYGISKYIGEKLAIYTLEKKCCIIRIADVYGPGQNHGNLIKAIISNVENKENIKLYGKGERERDYIYIDDDKYNIYGAATRAIEIESIISPQAAEVIVSHFDKINIEIERNTVYLYTENERPTEAQIEKLVSNALWLAEVIDTAVQQNSPR